MPVIAGIFIACTAADLPADLVDADDPYFIADAHMLLLAGILLVACKWTTIRLYHMCRSANWHALFVTIAGYLLTLVDMGDAQPVAPVDELLSSISDLAWGGILALAFVEPLRSRYAGTSLSSSGGANVWPRLESHRRLVWQRRRTPAPRPACWERSTPRFPPSTTTPAR